MACRSFRLRAGLRALVLAVALGAFFCLLFRTPYVLAPALAAAAAVAAFLELLRFVEASNRGMAAFLDALRSADFTGGDPILPEGAGFRELDRAFRAALADCRRAGREREEERLLLANALSHVGIGLVVYRRDGTVEIENHAARAILGTGNLYSLERLGEKDPKALEAILNLRDGERRTLRLGPDGAVAVSAYSTRFVSGQAERTVLSLQDIRRELSENEAESWHRMASVLAHEIMNSVTPISSLASTAAGILRGSRSGADLEDAAEAVSVIERRSAGLLSFVESYRALTRLPPPVPAAVPLSDAFRRVLLLLAEETGRRGVDCAAERVPEGLVVLADPDQLDTVLINVVKNALEAVEGREAPRVRIAARRDALDAVAIEVADNGTGMDSATMEMAFIPFFTTRPKGSGIGLSLSREIVLRGGGRIELFSAPGDGTMVRVTLPGTGHGGVPGRPDHAGDGPPGTRDGC